jgi:hypothetical protein
MTAEVDYYIFSVRVEYNTNQQPKRDKLDWATFQSSFLPPKEKACTINVLGGLLSQTGMGAGATAVMNCKTPAFTIDTVIPVNRAIIGVEHPTELNWKTMNSQKSSNLPGILPMQVAPETLDSLLTINITHQIDGDVTEKFTFTPVLKSVPAALWGKAGDIPANDPNPKTTLVENTVMGFELQPAPNLPAGINSCVINRDALGKEVLPGDTFITENIGPTPTSTLTVAQRRDGILQDIGMGESQIDFSHLPASETLLRTLA